MLATGAPPLADPLVSLCSSVAALAEEAIDGVPDSALEEQLVEIRHQIDRLEAEFCRRLRRFNRARGFVASGAASAVAWLRNPCRLSASAAHERVEVARELEAFPEIEAAWRAEEIGYQHAAVLARSIREVGQVAMRGALDELLDAARRLDPGRLRYVTRFLRYCVDPDGARAAEDKAHGRRYVDLSQTFDGIFVLSGQLDDEGGAMLRAAIGALTKPLPEDSRTAAQRRADALVELARRQLQDGKLPRTHGQRPHLVVTVPAATLHGDGSQPAEIAGAGPVSRELVQRLACDASITRITVAPSGAPLSAGEASPTIVAPLRTALGVRDRGCRFPGCDRPPEWTDAHHLRQRAHHGPTRADNLVLLCRVHHRAVHEGGWHLRRTEGGGLQALPP